MVGRTRRRIARANQCFCVETHLAADVELKSSVAFRAAVCPVSLRFDHPVAPFDSIYRDDGIVPHRFKRRSRRHFWLGTESVPSQIHSGLRAHKA